MTMTVQQFDEWLDRKFDGMRNRVKHKKSYKTVTICRKWKRKRTGRRQFKAWAVMEYKSLPFVQLGLDPGNVKLEIDKDLFQFLFAEKVYSPDTCCIIPKEINDILMGMERNGKGYEKIGNRYRVKASVDGKQQELGYYDTPEEAHKVYLRNRADYLYSKALEYRLYMTDRTFRAIEKLCKSL